jgi:hypothetical protein
MEEDILSDQDHRPFLLLAGPWVMEQSWDDGLLFAHCLTALKSNLTNSRVS